jgi:hypothetical protein
LRATALRHPAAAELSIGAKPGSCKAGFCNIRAVSGVTIMRELIDQFLASATWAAILFVVFLAVVLWAALR